MLLATLIHDDFLDDWESSVKQRAEVKEIGEHRPECWMWRNEGFHLIQFVSETLVANFIGCDVSNLIRYANGGNPCTLGT